MEDLKVKTIVLAAMVIACLFCGVQASAATDIDVGVYYFPGWHSRSDYWNDLKGLPGSRSPGVPWPNRTPLLGYYPEEETWVAEKHIEWAAQYGIGFFAHEFFWRNGRPVYEHALKAHVSARNKKDVRFCLFWANEGGSPPALQDFDAMVDYWLANYVPDETYYSVYGMPLVFVFDPDTLTRNAQKLGITTKDLLARANDAAREKGYKGFFFVALLSFYEPSDSVEAKYLGQGYSGYSAYNYVAAKDKAQYADYDSMVDTQIDFYRSAAKTKRQLLYMPSASPGYDGRPWARVRPKIYVRKNPTPAKFKKVLVAARDLLSSAPKGTPRIVTIGAWNEFGEGSYIEPTKEWGMQYLETIRDVFGAGAPKK